LSQAVFCVKAGLALHCLAANQFRSVIMFYLLQVLMCCLSAVCCLAQVQQLRGSPDHTPPRQLQQADSSCSEVGADRWGPDLEGCCSGLQECEEPRPDDHSYYCAPSDPQHRTSCWSYIVLCRAECTSARAQLIQSGNTVYLKTRSGSGAYIDVENTDTVRARFDDRGSWQAIVIEKDDGVFVSSGDIVHLKSANTGTYMDVQGTQVRARWNDKGAWQAMTVEKRVGSGPIQDGDVVCIRAHTGSHLDVDNDVVQARYNDCGDWQAMVLEKKDRDVSEGAHCAPLSQWPDVDNGITCGSCTALVQTAPYGGKCDTYCRSFGQVCVSAAEEVDENCEVEYIGSCTSEIQSTSDMLCTCRTPAEADYGFVARGVAGPTEVWIAKDLGVLACYTAVMGDSRCAKDFFTYVARGDANCGCKGSNGELSIRGDENADYYRNQLYTPPSSGDGSELKVMSYNTEYKGYWDGRLNAFAQKIREVDAGIVGIQECQDVSSLSKASGYEYLSSIGNRNPILYNSNKVTYVDGSAGTMDIPRDNHAQRYISFAKFRLGSKEFWAFNTHLPHNHNEASSRNTHAQIAQMLLQKRVELGAANMPTVVTGDMNPFASNGASAGSFETNLVAGGFQKSYQGRGNPGYGGLDKILHSRSHWTASNGADQGTGRSDHPAIAVDLTLIRFV